LSIGKVFPAVEVLEEVVPPPPPPPQALTTSASPAATLAIATDLTHFILTLLHLSVASLA